MHGGAIPLHSEMNKQVNPNSAVSTITTTLQDTIKLPPLSELEVLAVSFSSTSDTLT